MEQAKKGEGYIVEKYSDISITTSGYLKSSSNRYVIVDLSAIAESRIAFEERPFWVVWYSAENLYFVIMLDEIIGNIVYSERFGPKVLAYD